MRSLTVSRLLVTALALRFGEVVASGSPPQSLPIRELRLELVEERTYTILPRRYVARTVSEAGDLYFLSYPDYTVQKVAPTGETVVTILKDLPEVRRLSAQIMTDVAVDAAGQVYVPLLWRTVKGRTKITHSGFVVIDRNGKYVHIIELKPHVEIRHAAVDAMGSVYVLGVDPDYFWQRTNDCLLVHKYSPQGQRVASFSKCPPIPNLRRVGDIRPGPGYNLLMKEADLGSIWIREGRIHHVLPQFRMLRQFSATGEMVRETVFGLQSIDALLRRHGLLEGDTGSARLNLVLPLAGSQFLVMWQASETSNGVQRNLRFLSVHDLLGKPMTTPSAVSQEQGLPMAADGAGGSYFIVPMRSPSGYHFKFKHVRVQGG